MGRTRKTANLVNDLVGIDTTAKSTFTDIDFSGDIAGDGGQLSGIAAGLGTALSSDTTNPLSNIYYTNQVLEIDNTSTIDVPSSAKVAYTQFAEIQVNGTADLIIADGDDLVPDILGIGTTGTSSGTLAGGGGRLRADNITGKEGVSAPTFPSGLVVTGVSTFASLSADAISADSFNSNSSLIVSGGLLVGTAATFNGNVNIAGVLTYDDVTNIDSVGLITARSGIIATGVVTATSFVSGGLEVSPSELIDSGSTTRVSVNTSGAIITGILTATAGNDLNGYKVENGSISGSGLNGVINYNLDDGHIQKYTGSTGGNYGPNFRVSGSKTLSSIMDVGDVVTTTLMVSSSSHYLTNGNIQIDGSTSNLDIDYVGGDAPDSANGSGFDIYTFTIQKTSTTPAYHIVVNAMGAN